jgi:hypothetical protein
MGSPEQATKDSTSEAGRGQNGSISGAASIVDLFWTATPPGYILACPTLGLGALRARLLPPSRAGMVSGPDILLQAKKSASESL